MAEASTPRTRIAGAQIIQAIGWFAEYADTLNVANDRPIRARLAALALLEEVSEDGKQKIKLVGFLAEDGERADQLLGFLGYVWAPGVMPRDPWGD